MNVRLFYVHFDNKLLEFQNEDDGIDNEGIV